MSIEPAPPFERSVTLMPRPWSERELASLKFLHENKVAGLNLRRRLWQSTGVARAKKEIELKIEELESGPFVNLVEPSILDTHPLVKLQSLQCCWPIGDPRHADFRYCTAGRDVALPYCAEHHALAYAPRAPRPR